MQLPLVLLVSLIITAGTMSQTFRQTDRVDQTKLMLINIDV